MLPDGKHVLFTLATGIAPNRWETAKIVVQSLTAGDPTELFEGSDARYVPTGHLVYARSGSLYAVGFDPDQRKVTGSHVPVLDGVSRAAGIASEFGPTGGANFSFSDTGDLIFVQGPISVSATNRDIGVQDRNGDMKPMGLSPGPYATPRVSPDGMRLVIGSDDKEGTIWTTDLSGPIVR